MNCIISINLSLKYQKFTPSGCKEMGIQKFEVVAKTQFLLLEGEDFVGVLHCYIICMCIK